MASKKNISFLLLMYSSSLICMEASPIQIDEQEYALFKMVQKIRAIAGQARKEINRAITMKDTREIDKSPPYHFLAQIKQGLLLLADENPNELITPWGKLRISTNTSNEYCYLECIAAFQLFFKRIKASINAFSHFPEYYDEIVEPIDLELKEKNYELACQFACRKIPDERVHRYIGKRALVVSSRCGMITRYMIEQVDAEAVPTVEFYGEDKKSEYRTEETITTIWKAMQERYDKEKAEFNREFFTAPNKNQKLYLSKLPAELLHEIGKYYND